MAIRNRLICTRAARDSGVSAERLERVAAEIAKALDGDTYFKAFSIDGTQFALSTRIIIEVDAFPHRVPERTIGEKDVTVRRRARRCAR